jgi:hypothetical protein
MGRVGVWAPDIIDRWGGNGGLGCMESFFLAFSLFHLGLSFWNRLATCWRPRFLRFEATSCLVTHEHELLFTGSHVQQRLKREKIEKQLLPAFCAMKWCYCSEQWSMAPLFTKHFLKKKTVEACLHCSVNRFFFLTSTLN